MSHSQIRARRGAAPLAVLVSLLLGTFLAASPADAQRWDLPPEPPVRYDDDLLPASFHEGRREAVMAELPDNAVALFFGAPARNRSNDVDFEYRQDSDLFYLTGTHEPGSALLLIPGGAVVDGERVREVLFVPPRDPAREIWTGRRFGTERAEEVLGVEKAVENTRFREVAGPLLTDSARRLFHLPLPGGVAEGSTLDTQLDVMAERARFADAAVDARTLRRVLNRLRVVKTDEEMVLLRRAIDITADAHREVMRALEPGMREYEAEALLEYVFRRNGAEYPGFPSIVGSGENAVILHYESNRRPMEEGDLVVIDIGAEYHGYTADITRTLPVSGSFTPEQRQIYELVLRVQEAGIRAVRAGASFAAAHQAAYPVLARGLAELGLVDDPADRRQVSRFFMHGTSHYLGLDVHDVGVPDPLSPGTVLTVEPGIYIAPAEDVDPRWWNIGVRIEDDVLVTGDEPVVLSTGAPRTVEEIEALMAEPSRTTSGS